MKGGEEAIGKKGHSRRPCKSKRAGAKICRPPLPIFRFCSRHAGEEKAGPSVPLPLEAGGVVTLNRRDQLPIWLERGRMQEGPRWHEDGGKGEGGVMFQGNDHARGGPQGSGRAAAEPSRRIAYAFYFYPSQRSVVEGERRKHQGTTTGICQGGAARLTPRRIQLGHQKR